VFTAFIQPALKTYWDSLHSTQRSQLDIRGYKAFEDMWNDVTGNGDPGNMAYATTANARYLSRENPKLDPATAKNCSPETIEAGLKPVEFYDANVSLSFSSTKTPSHMTAPGSGTKFSMLEGLPHNKVHNYIGGVGPLNPGPYGNMTNFLSPVDPIFHLHHANLDRLWDVWTRKQESIGKPILPTGADLQTLSDERFLFYVNGYGQFVGPSKASEYFSMSRFDYEYEPGFPENLESINPRPKHKRTQVRGAGRGNRATLAVSSEAVKEHLAAPAATLVAEVTVPHPSPSSETREFHVLVGAPPDVTEADPSSPFFAGTLSFFGNMSHRHGTSGDATFAVPLPKAPEAFKSLAATNATVDIRIVPADKRTQRPPLLKSATIRSIE
jgi:tyrosinase